MLNRVKCPVCGGDIVEHRKSFSCSNWKMEDGGCNFAIWKSNFGCEFSAEDVIRLIQGEVLEKTNISKKGNPYQALWRLNENYETWFDYIAPETVAVGD